MKLIYYFKRYGTPYLLSLELSKELTALVWLAGPLSGLLVQPLIGAFSDKCTSRFGKRRPYIFVSGILTCLSMLGVAYARDMADWIVAKGPYEDDESQKAAVSVSLYFILTSSSQGISFAEWRECLTFSKNTCICWKQCRLKTCKILWY